MLNGYKTYIAAFGAMATGVGMMAAVLTADVVDFMALKDGLLVFLGGLVALGLGHKVEKLVNVLKGV